MISYTKKCRCPPLYFQLKIPLTFCGHYFGKKLSIYEFHQRYHVYTVALT